jgi:antitoxin YefM
MPDSLSMREAREMLTRLPEMLAGEAEPHAITITRRGEPVLVVLPYDFYESLVETMEIMGDPSMMDALRQGIADIAAGRTISLSDLEEQLGR